MATEPDRPLVTREIAERDDAHRRYNEALTALDKAIQSMPEWPAPPPPYDEHMLPAINEAWKILPGEGAAPSTWGADKAWRLVAPLFERQMAFNAALVDHLNRNAAAHREIHDAVARALPATRESLEALSGFESLLVQFLQRITPLADARDRETQKAIKQLRHVAEVAQRAAVMAKREIERIAARQPQRRGCCGGASFFGGAWQDQGFHRSLSIRGLRGSLPRI